MEQPATSSEERPDAPRLTNFDRVVTYYHHPEFFFVQVGANDGITDDDLRAYILAKKWSGVLVEPLPDVFSRLKANYLGLNWGLEFVNAAIAEEDGTVEFYRHPSLTQCSGLYPRTRMQLRAEMEKVSVPALTWKSLLDTSRPESQPIDLLQIDVEGFDLPLLELFPYDRVLPRIIRYEHKHATPSHREEFRKKMLGLGYQSFVEGPDTVFYR